MVTMDADHEELSKGTNIRRGGEMLAVEAQRLFGGGPRHVGLVEHLERQFARLTALPETLFHRPSLVEG
jgi:hypothetical protein